MVRCQKYDYSKSERDQHLERNRIQETILKIQMINQNMNPNSKYCQIQSKSQNQNPNTIRSQINQKSQITILIHSMWYREMISGEKI